MHMFMSYTGLHRGGIHYSYSCGYMPQEYVNTYSICMPTEPIPQLVQIALDHTVLCHTQKEKRRAASGFDAGTPLDPPPPQTASSTASLNDPSKHEKHRRIEHHAFQARASNSPSDPLGFRFGLIRNPPHAANSIVGLDNPSKYEKTEEQSIRLCRHALRAHPTSRPPSPASDSQFHS